MQVINMGILSYKHGYTYIFIKDHEALFELQKDVIQGN